MGKELTLFIKNDPTTLRIFPELATEIGLNESILLLQIDFLLKTSDNYRDGKYWTFQSIHDLKKKYFNFWSTSTINRTINSLEKQKLIYVANFNKRKYDKTRWFALNEEGLSKLKNINIKIDTHDTRSNQNDTGSTQYDTRSNQNDTTIPETTAEITSENTTVGAKSDKGKPGKKDSVSDTSYPVSPNSYSVSVDEIFLKDFVEKNKEKDFRCVKLCETLLNRAESMEFPAKDNIGDVIKFKDKLARFNKKNEKGEISGALELYNALPINSYHRRNITEYINHEWQKWDFSKTKNENTVKGQFILEYILWHPVYAHFKSVKDQGLLAQDIANYAKRNRKPKEPEQELTELEQDWLEMTA